jgi:hypothetical protein
MLLAACVLTVAVPAQAGQPVIDGRSSWYGGPCDSSDNNITASGIPNTVPGFAARWGGFGTRWVARAPNGRRAILVRLEYGPASFTGRNIDINYSGVRALGYPVNGNGCASWPTDSYVRAEMILTVHRGNCGWPARRALGLLRHHTHHFRQRSCYRGRAVESLHRFQRNRHLPVGSIGPRTWLRLY